MSFPEALECLYWIIYPHHRVHKQHCTVIPLSLIDLQTVIGKSGSVVVSECWVLDGCPETQLSLSFHSVTWPLFILFFSSLISCIYQPMPFSKYLHLLHLPPVLPPFSHPTSFHPPSLSNSHTFHVSSHHPCLFFLFLLPLLCPKHGSCSSM